ncbi:Hsp33 family molecular chaperone HslO [Silanimonas lenta]|uniref:Hsp33 family molecular chaperone HslO n=1 Tax=Silanimonas lenta TaxID=265429 RepID=UPI002FE250C8
MRSTDTLTRFLIEHTGVRGVLVSLDGTWREIAGRAPYPPAVARLLGETAAAAALFCGHVKVDGRLSLQLRGSGALRSLFVECTSMGTLRGLARHAEAVPDALGPRDFGEGAMLAITIETLPPGQREMQRYQGMVGLEADSLRAAFEAYFRQSEQLPTALLLAANGERAAGLMLQKLPGETGDEDAWRRVEALFDTLHAPELLAGPDTDLLWRLFHEDGVRVLSQQPLAFHCSCSLARVEEMFQGLGEAEAMAALQEGEARVHCEFCGRDYRVDAGRMRALFAPGARPNASGSPGLQ